MDVLAKHRSLTNTRLTNNTELNNYVLIHPRRLSILLSIIKHPYLTSYNININNKNYLLSMILL